MSNGRSQITGMASTERLEHIRGRIAVAAKAAGRMPNGVSLVAVSKTFGAEDIRPILAAGQRVFGENRVQEAEAKWPQLKAEFPDVVLHLIGPLQSNKARNAVRLFDVIQTVDRPKLVYALREAIDREGTAPRFFVQVNTGNEPQKSGVALEEIDSLIQLANNLGLLIEGLMCIPPIGEEASLHFALLSKLAAERGLKKLSMGMSADFELAIALGATHVRVGSAIFGERG